MSKAQNVREIVVEWLKDNGYDGLLNPDINCSCVTNERCAWNGDDMQDCIPGVLVDGKIVGREK